MRVICRGMENGDIEGELIGGEFLDPDRGEFELEETFTVRCDNGTVLHVHGWLVDIIMVDGDRWLGL